MRSFDGIGDIVVRLIYALTAGDLILMNPAEERGDFVVVGTDTRAEMHAATIVMRIDRSGRGIYFSLVPTHQRAYEYRLVRASFDDLKQAARVVSVLKRSTDMALSHGVTSSEEIKVYFELMMAEKEASGQKKPHR